MGEIQIRFRMNMETGKKDILIEYESDEDAMRHEHEKDHRSIVEKLVGAGVLQEEEVGEVTVERVEPQREPDRRVEEGPQGEQQASSS